tara:strand:+ start:125 stop:313 length:189 start_codon:yes stop_codon:yes gene_type:complete
MVGHNILSLDEILEHLKKLDEVELIDLLGITSEELIEYVQDYIEEDMEKYSKYINDNIEDEK